MIQTFIIEWDTESLCSLVIAEETLKLKAENVRKLKHDLANRQYDQMAEMSE